MKHITITDTENGNVVLDLETQSYILFAGYEEVAGVDIAMDVNAKAEALIFTYYNALQKIQKDIIDAVPDGEEMLAAWNNLLYPEATRGDLQ